VGPEAAVPVVGGGRYTPRQRPRGATLASFGTSTSGAGAGRHLPNPLRSAFGGRSRVRDDEERGVGLRVRRSAHAQRMTRKYLRTGACSRRALLSIRRFTSPLG